MHSRHQIHIMIGKNIIAIKRSKSTQTNAATVASMVCPDGYTAERYSNKVRNMDAERNKELCYTCPPTV